MADVTTTHLEKDVNTLHERTQETKASLSTHEAVCKERYEKTVSYTHLTLPTTPYE